MIEPLPDSGLFDDEGQVQVIVSDSMSARNFVKAENEKTVKNIAVIGAGPAGLMAAEQAAAAGG